MDDRLSKTMVPVGGNLHEEVRFFTDAKIQGAIDNALKSVSSDKKGVVLKVDVDGHGAKAVLAARPGEHWTIGLISEYDWSNKDFSGGAQVVFEW